MNKITLKFTDPGFYEQMANAARIEKWKYVTHFSSLTIEVTFASETECKEQMNRINELIQELQTA